MGLGKESIRGSGRATRPVLNRVLAWAVAIAMIVSALPGNGGMLTVALVQSVPPTPSPQLPLPTTTPTPANLPAATSTASPPTRTATSVPPTAVPTVDPSQNGPLVPILVKFRPSATSSDIDAA